MTGRPVGTPLHGKRALVYIGLTGGDIKFVSFATDFSVDFSAENTSKAVVLATDVIADIETHGFAAKSRINLLLTSKEVDFLQALGLTGGVVDYNKAAANLVNNTDFLNTSRIDVIIATLENPIASTEGVAAITDDPDTDGDESADAIAATSINTISDLATLRGKTGYVIELTSAAMTGMEITGRVGEYTTARLEAESGRFRIAANDGSA